MPLSRKGKVTVLVVAAGFFSAVWRAWAGDVAEPVGYRMEEYRAPVPATLRGARVVSTAEAETLWREKQVVFFDVMPRTPKPANLPEGTIWRDTVRTDIPDSIWLANVGYGAIPKETEDYFRSGLAAHTKSQADAVLFYCMTNCWMSWNAAKRAMEWGYKDVIWYPEGTDGWQEAGNDLASVASMP